jgi:branched-chain amino acid transport system substrate-binding protein
MQDKKAEQRGPLRKRLLMALAAGTLALSAQAQFESPSEGVYKDRIDWGVMMDLSGPASGSQGIWTNGFQAYMRALNERGGVKTSEGAHRLQIARYDSKGQVEEALSMLNLAIEQGARIVLQGNSSAVAGALVDALQKHNERYPDKASLFLNYAAVDPALTQERCSFWHFRFDAHAQMRMQALMAVLAKDSAVTKAYLIGQDYSFGQAVLKEAQKQLKQQRPDVEIVGEELHPMGRVKDFLPYAIKIKASGAQAVITGNFGNDLSLLIKAAKDAGYKGKFYTFYGNALGAPAAIGEAGMGRVLAVADWMPNVAGKASVQFYQGFKRRFPNPEDDYAHLRMHLMVEALAKAIESSGVVQAIPLARALEKSRLQLWGQDAFMRAADHQWQQPLVVGVMDRQGQPGVAFDVEGSGWGFRIIHQMTATQAEMPSSCTMKKPF